MSTREKIMEWVVGTFFMTTLLGAGWFCLVVF